MILRSFYRGKRAKAVGEYINVDSDKIRPCQGPQES